jgi:hypothetical protein
VGAAALGPEGEGDLPALALVADVSHDAEEVACVRVGGERGGAALAFEDRDAFDDDVDRVPCDSSELIPVGVGEAEAGEGRCKCAPHEWIEPRIAGLPRLVLLTDAFVERLPRPFDLLE